MKLKELKESEDPKEELEAAIKKQMSKKYYRKTREQAIKYLTRFSPHLFQELKESEESVDIAIGYDDHTSVYRLPIVQLKAAMKIDNADDLNDFIIDKGYAVDDADSHIDRNIFFDLTNNDIAEFRSQAKEVV